MSASAVRWGHYTAVTLLRQGPSGAEYDARDTADGERVVVVLGSPGNGEGSKAAARDFLDRASAAMQLGHPGIVAVREVGVEPSTGQPFVVLLRPVGRTVAELRREGSSFSPLEVATIGATVADALEHAHQRGIVHAHLSTERLIMTAHGTVVVDGFALLPVSSPADTRDGAGAAEASVRGDLFALGVILYELATGVPPFDGSESTAGAASPTPPSRLSPTLPPALGAAIFRLVQVDPAKRPASAGEVARFLDGVRRSIVGEAAGPTTRPPKAARRAPRGVGVRLAVALGAVGFLVLVALLALWPHPRPAPTAPTPVGRDPAARGAQMAAIETALANDDIVAARRLLNGLETAQGRSAATADLGRRVESRAVELADRLFSSGVAAMSSGHLAEAAEAFRAVLVLRPDHVEARRDLGAVRDRQLAEARASSIPAPPRPTRRAAPRAGPTLGVSFDSPLPAGRIDVTVDGTPFDAIRFDFTRSAFMGLQRRASGHVRRAWPVEAGDHRVVVALSDGDGRLLREETFNLSLRPTQSLVVRIEMAGPAASPSFVLVPTETGAN
jgi:hypothetical protein